MKLCTVISAFVISRRSFSSIKGYISSDTIDHLLCNQCEIHFSDKDIDKSNEPQFIWSTFYLIILHLKDIRNHYHSVFILEIVTLEWHE